MKKISFNQDWKCYKKGQRTRAFEVTIPHDAMLLDEKKENSPSGVNNGWYDVCDYTYEKTFFVPEDDKNNTVILEFEGVYRKATVILNGKKIAYHDYGYTGFFVDISGDLNYGGQNTLQIDVGNSDQPNSRWYSGTGIYRPVWMYRLPKKHIELEGIHISTVDTQRPRIKAEILTTDSGEITVEILDGNRTAASFRGETDGKFVCELEIPDGKLWSPEQQFLYTCRVTYGEDVQEEQFGIRTVSWSEEGLCINGERVILRGACIHHDNGILGACAYDFAEYRKVKLLKENGYNAIRSAHNPCSKAMLRACDELGMLMMDEYVDVWYIHKTKYDYAGEVLNNYRDDLKAMVNKDFNHPSVILYSTGNEVSETAQKKGIAFCKTMTDYLHELDETRPVTCGINIFFNFLSSMGFGVYSDKKADQAAENAKKKKAVGSEFFNNLAGIFGSNFMKFGATLYPCDVKTRGAFANMDIAGYNYGIFRYRHDLKKYPNRLILGSETFCSDAYRFWEEAKTNKRLIGDFVWAGMDYLGEVGIGAWEYKDYAPRFDGGKGWVSAGSGRIDLTGKPLSEMAYTRVAFELDEIGMGVIPVNHTNDKHSPSAWKMTNAMESWSWSGYEGADAVVEVYTRADHVSLFLNGICVGTKKRKNDCRIRFRTKYQNGELKAVAYDEKNQAIAEKVLRSASEKTALRMEPEQTTVKLENELCYIRLRYTDENGVGKPLVHGEIKVSAEGGMLIGLGSACPYYTKKYLDDTADTYYGEALAVVRPTKCGELIVTAKSQYGEARTVVKVI